MAMSYKKTAKRTEDAIKGTYQAFCRTATAEQIDRVDALMRMSFDLGKIVHMYEMVQFYDQHKKDS